MVKLGMFILNQTFLILIGLSCLMLVELSRHTQILPNPTIFVGIYQNGDVTVVKTKVTKSDEISPKEQFINDVYDLLLTDRSGDMKPHSSVYGLNLIGQLYRHISRLDHEQNNLLVTNKAQQFISNRGLKADKIESACVFKNDDTIYKVLLPKDVKPTSAHSYGDKTFKGEHVSASTSESLLSDYERGFSGGVQFDPREAVFTFAYLLDQSLSGYQYSGEQSLKSMPLRVLCNVIEKVRVSLHWTLGGKLINLVYELPEIKLRCEAFKPNWDCILSTPFAKSISGKSAVATIDTSIEAEIDESLFEDW